MTLYDFDDAEYLRHDPSTIYFFMQRCTIVQVGSKLLVEHCKKYNARVAYNPSAVSRHLVQNTGRNKRLTLGWVGDYGGGVKDYAFSHKNSFEKLVFPSLLKIDIPIDLVLLGVRREQDRKAVVAYFSRNRNVRLVIPQALNWEEDSWVYSEIAKFDFGLAPLIDHEFNRAKSAFKLKQYLSVGVPSLASAVGENNIALIPGKNGWLFSNAEEFDSCLSAAANLSDQEYWEMSDVAKNNAHKFSIQHFAEEFLQIVNHSKRIKKEPKTSAEIIENESAAVLQ